MPISEHKTSKTKKGIIGTSVFANAKTKIKSSKFNISFGFTLIELLVVIALIGLLSTLALSNFNAARTRGRDAARKSDLRNIQTALRLYYNDVGVYPDGTGAIDGCDGGGCVWGGSFTNAGIVYMSVLPNDPLPAVDYIYTKIDADTYTLRACLENESDNKKEAVSVTNCPTDVSFSVSS